MKWVAAIIDPLFLLIVGAAIMFGYDRRPADFPSIHIHFLWKGFDWSAPDSLKVSSFKSGAIYQSKINNTECIRTLNYVRAKLDQQTKAVEVEHNQEIQAEKNALLARKNAEASRKKEAWVLAGIDKMHTTGNSCQRAEQIIRGVIQ